MQKKLLLSSMDLNLVNFLLWRAVQEKILSSRLPGRW